MTRLVFRGLFIYRFRAGRCDVGIANGLDCGHVPGLAVLDKDGKLKAGPYGPEVLRGITDALQPRKPASVTVEVEDPDIGWDDLPESDFRWVLDLERELAGGPVRENVGGYYGTFRVHQGNFRVRCLTTRPVRILDESGAIALKRRLADVIECRVDGAMVLLLGQVGPIDVGENDAVAIKNYEPPGAPIASGAEHLAALTRCVGGLNFRYHPDDEEGDPAHISRCWQYPNNAPPLICGGAVLGLSYPIERNRRLKIES